MFQKELVLLNRKYFLLQEILIMLSNALVILDFDYASSVCIGPTVLQLINHTFKYLTIDRILSADIRTQIDNSRTSMPGRGPGPGGHSTFFFFFFGGCVPRGFQNVGAKEWIFLEKWGSWEWKFGKKFGFRELEFGPKHG